MAKIIQDEDVKRSFAYFIVALGVYGIKVLLSLRNGHHLADADDRGM